MGIYFLLSGPVYLCMIINALKMNTINTPFFTMPYLEGNARTSDMVFFTEQPVQQLIENVKTLIYVIFYRHDNKIWNCIDGFGTIYVCTLPFVFWGIFLLIQAVVKEKNINKRCGCLLLLVMYFSGLCVGVIVSNININRINIIFYEHIIFAGIAITHVCTHLKKMIGVLAGIYICLFALFLNCYFTDWNEALNKRFGKNMMDAICYASEYNVDEYHISADDMYIIYGFNMEMDYYYGKTDYFRGENKAYEDRFFHDEVEKDAVNKENEGKSIIYVQYQIEKDKFEGSSYQIQEFGDWFVAISQG